MLLSYKASTWNISPVMCWVATTSFTSTDGDIQSNIPKHEQLLWHVVTHAVRDAVIAGYEAASCLLSDTPLQRHHFMFKLHRRVEAKCNRCQSTRCCHLCWHHPENAAKMGLVPQSLVQSHSQDYLQPLADLQSSGSRGGCTAWVGSVDAEYEWEEGHSSDGAWFASGYTYLCTTRISCLCTTKI